jgi:hypothetical protein
MGRTIGTVLPSAAGVSYSFKYHASKQLFGVGSP